MATSKPALARILHSSQSYHLAPNLLPSLPLVTLLPQSHPWSTPLAALVCSCLLVQYRALPGAFAVLPASGPLAGMPSPAGTQHWLLRVQDPGVSSGRQWPPTIGSVKQSGQRE
jgi:hypothetical protein